MSLVVGRAFWSGALRVAARDLAASFAQPVPYALIGLFCLFAAGWTFAWQPFFVLERATVRPLFELLPFLFTILVPALTMRAFAEARRAGTLEVWLTWPLGDGALVLGRFLGAWALVGLALGLTAGVPITVAALGPLPLGPVLGGYLGLWILAGACVALGLLASALTASQVVAFVVGFALCFGFYAIGQAAAFAPPAVADLLTALSFERRFADFARGVVDSRDLVYFASVTLAALALTVEVLRSRRWR